MKNFTRNRITTCVVVVCYLLLTRVISYAQPYTINRIYISGHNVPYIKNITTLDGGSMIVLHTQDSSNFLVQPIVLMKLDVNGAVEWTQSYGPYGTFGDIVQCPDSGYVINNVFAFGTYCAFKVDKNGVLQYAKKYALPAGDQLILAGHCVARDNGCVWCSGLINISGSSYRHLFEVDANGNVLISNYYTVGSGYGGKITLKNCDNGDLLMMGSYLLHTNNTWYNCTSITRIDTSGAMVWSKNYYSDSMALACYDMVHCTGDRIYVMGSTGWDPFLMEIDSSSDVVWCEKLSAADTMYPRNLMLTPEGGLVITGERMFIKTDSAGGVLSARSYPDFIVEAADILTPTIYQLTLHSFTDLEGYIMLTDSSGASCSDSPRLISRNAWHVSDTAISGSQSTNLTVTADSLISFQLPYQFYNECSSTFIQETVHENAFQVFPDPAADHITITSSEKFTAVEIVDISGRTILTNTTSGDNMQLDVSRLSAGCYVVRILFEDRIETTRLVIKK